MTSCFEPLYFFADATPPGPEPEAMRTVIDKLAVAVWLFASVTLTVNAYVLVG
jgi:hypothetical protein